VARSFAFVAAPSACFLALVAVKPPGFCFEPRLCLPTRGGREPRGARKTGAQRVLQLARSDQRIHDEGRAAFVESDIRHEVGDDVGLDPSVALLAFGLFGGKPQQRHEQAIEALDTFGVVGPAPLHCRQGERAETKSWTGFRPHRTQAP
jgi:hypothetical protein